MSTTESKCADCGGNMRPCFVGYVSCSRCGHVFPKGGK